MSTTRPVLDPMATLTPTQALAWAAQINRDATDLLRSGTFGPAAQMAQVAMSLTAYATATGRWQGR